MSGRKRNGVLVVWPGGAYDFVLDGVTEKPGSTRGWVTVYGLVVQPAGGKHRVVRGFYARRTDYGYEMMPANRDPVEIWKTTAGRI
ncbi:hypothetical protein [Actinoplanes regularis]|uniref:hypothetical protein n=1 Tax=Actinoplanes regularis TaxID=52697 RepID=UPI0024A12F65|nr:hypothetical protein [Actinoplanes regularis]GLW35219.1 hypothetical protein Areg01_81550 [Actinoplanes regularis]